MEKGSRAQQRWIAGMLVGAEDGDLGRNHGVGKCEDQPRTRGTFMALKVVVRKKQVGGHAVPLVKGEKQRMLLWVDGHREALAYNIRRQAWKTACRVKTPAVRQGKKKFTGLFLIKLDS